MKRTGMYRFYLLLFFIRLLFSSELTNNMHRSNYADVSAEVIKRDLGVMKDALQNASVERNLGRGHQQIADKILQRKGLLEVAVSDYVHFFHG